MKKIIIFLILCFLWIPSIVSAKYPIKEINLLEDSKIVNDIAKEKATDESYLMCKEDTYIPYSIARVVRSIIKLIKYVVPILLIIMGMLDFGKVVLGKPDEQMKKSKKAFFARLFAAVLVFLVVNIVEMILRIVSTDDENIKCLKCIVVEEDCRYVDISYPEVEKPTPTPTQTPTVKKVPTTNPTQTNTPEPPKEVVKPEEKEIDSTQ